MWYKILSSKTWPLSADKRSKRNRGSSPLSTPSTPAPTPVNNKPPASVKPGKSSHNHTLQPPQTLKNDAKSRSRPYARQFPLQEHRKVAFRPPSTGGNEGDENTWILAVVTRCLNQEKHRLVFLMSLLINATLC